MAKKKTNEIDVPVSFGGLSIGDNTARLGVTINRSVMRLPLADEALCCTRVACKVVAMCNGASPDQKALPGIEAPDWEVETIADIKGFAANDKAITCGLTFNLQGLDVETLCHFPKREGRLVITGIEDIPDGEDEDA